MKDQSKTKQSLIQKKASLDIASEYAESIINTVREPLIVLDQDLRVVTASRSFYEFFKVKPEETEGQLIYNLGNDQWDIPKLRELLETILPEKTTFDNYEVEHDFTTIGKRIMLLNARQIKRALGKERIILLAIEDITERKQLESLLIDSEERYRHLFETASDGIVFLEQREGKITHANPASEKMLGYTKKELIGNKLQDIGVLLDMGDFQTTIQNLDKSGIIHYNDVSVRTKSGQQMDTDIYLVDRATLLQCSIRDVTERKRTEDALRQDEEKYRTILEDIQEGYFEVDFAGNFTFFNDSLQRFLGYSKEELMGMNNRQYINMEHSKKLFQAFNKVYNTGKPLEGFDWQIVRKDGTQKYVEASISLQKDSSGKPIGFRGIVRDVTDRKKAEEELKKEQLFNTAILDSIPGILYLYDDTGHLVHWNKQNEEVTGYSSEELKDMDVLDWFGSLEPDTSNIINSIADVMKNGHAMTEARIINKSGHAIPMILTGVKLAIDGKDYLLGIGIDITDRKQAEEELLKSEEKYRLVFEYSPLGLLSFDEKGVIVACNNNFVKIIGSSREKLIGLNMLKLPNENIVSAVQKALNGSHGLYEGEYSSVISRKITQVRCLFEPMDVGGGRIPGGVGIIEDITERTKAEEALRESENKYRLLADNIHDVIFVLDMNLNYTYVSPSTKILRGYEPEEVMKQLPSKALTPSSWDLVTKTIAEAMELEKEHRAINIFWTLQLEMMRKDGTTVWTEVKISVIRDENQRPVSILGITRDITERRKAEVKLQQTLDSLKKAVGATIQVMVSAVEMRDPYTAGHQLRAANLACAIATEMELPQDKIDGLRMAGSIHDIGKLSIPAEILSKPTKLTNIEFSLIKEHSQIGYDMLKDVESSWPLAQIVYQHHERMDGTGYPRNLKGDEILMEARIMAVSDVVEAMASHRPYRPGLGIDAALAEIEKNKGTFYDNTVADACLRLFREKGYQLT